MKACLRDHRIEWPPSPKTEGKGFTHSQSESTGFISQTVMTVGKETAPAKLASRKCLTNYLDFVFLA